MTYGLTPTQKRCFDFIGGYIRKHGYSPSHQEIAIGLGSTSRGSVHRMVSVLVERGKLVRLTARKRSIRVCESTIELNLPADMHAQIVALAMRVNVAPEAVALEAMRDGLSSYARRSSLRANSPAPGTQHLTPGRALSFHRPTVSVPRGRLRSSGGGA